ncbi:hypothetical protein FF38_09239 [Lucilia cuprina]|uniref:Uncharacterized protein n=1 Tax=Lucilia cuprina TaxID=7375 RepID=A0A0L0CNM1_LUCCU|nr:hypothetical protein FF38_09239 [Lucilia cuprina]
MSSLPTESSTKILPYLCQERRQFINRMNYCLNCLAITHDRFWCESPNRCQICGAKHHTMLHRNRQEVNSSSSSFEEMTSDRLALTTENFSYIPPLVRVEVTYHEQRLDLTFLLDNNCQT